ncbi:hypothetical protein KM176_05545 [Pseudooceanicola sp. CBS1P-1]|uniref:Uncharacterized protein n=1 Tax=Pseudooceanicola albus TaxID=2692189 RepID=A0A6L7FWY3_9RHOB|nr:MULTISPECIES: hypothetical protein [Pseudooceanicola]MBT9383316.1 hypothetical protein [Pseudooceanicola endophyticus]MXN16361.1 hypothetical protein [Pseudooceanicola albus]
MQQMSQADFARAMGVSRAAVSQWKAKDILREDAFSKAGKAGKILYEIAVEQVRRNRDIGQSLGNGIATRTTPDLAAGPADPAPRRAAVEAAKADPSLSLPLTPPPVAPVAPRSSEVIEPWPVPEPPPWKVDSIEDQLKRAKLEEQLRRNRVQSAEEAQRTGQLMAAADAREQAGRIAVTMLQIFEGALPDFAAALAARFDLPQRDVLHLLRAEMVKVRRSAAAKERSRAEAVAREKDEGLED